MGIDYKKIGRKIANERKNFKHISQERMAEELGMYQADISDLENGKPGSGINDIGKLDMVARYLGIALNDLLSDACQEKSEIRKEHLMEMKEILPPQIDSYDLYVLEGGAYSTYILEDADVEGGIITFRSYVFYGDRLISVNVSDIRK